MRKYIKGIYNSGIDFNCHRHGIGSVVVEVITKIYVKIDGEWKQAIAYVKVLGEWLLSRLYVKVSGYWR